MDNKIQDYSKSLKGLSSGWVAIKPNTTEVVAQGNSPKSVLDKANKIGVLNPVLTKIPKSYGAYIL